MHPIVASIVGSPRSRGLSACLTALSWALGDPHLSLTDRASSMAATNGTDNVDDAVPSFDPRS